MAERTKELAEVLKKVPLFRGLSPTQIRLILSQCTSNQFEAGEHICRSGNPSDEMYVLLGGKLAILAEDNVRVAVIDPVTTVGEMGAITGQPRSATVEAVIPTRILVLQKKKLDIILRGQRDLRSKLYENVIIMLSEKLVRDNVRMRDFLTAQARFEEQCDQRDLKLGVALDLLAEKGMNQEDADAEINARMDQLPRRILVVDDEKVSRTLLKKGLGQYAVSEAENGVEALKKIKADTPDLVITDIQMPAMDGVALLQLLRNEEPKLPVLAVTGFMDEQGLKQHDFDGYLLKPVSVTDLTWLVKETLKKGRVRLSA